MKALSVRNPWAWAICHGGKRVENRDWQHPPTYRGPLLIHASAWYSAPQIVDTMKEIRGRIPAGAPPVTLNDFKGHLRGAIVARANLVDVVRTDEHGHRTRAHLYPCDLCGERPVYAQRNCAHSDPWAIAGQLGFILADVTPLAVPVPWKGGLGFFEVPDHALSAAALA